MVAQVIHRGQCLRRVEKTRGTTLYEAIRLGRDSRACVGVATRTIKSNKELLYRYSRSVWKQLIIPRWRRGHLSCKIIAGMFSILFLCLVFFHSFSTRIYRNFFSNSLSFYFFSLNFKLEEFKLRIVGSSSIRNSFSIILM